MEMRPGMSRKLSSVAKRLDLLGFSENELPKKFAKTIDAMPEIQEDFPLTFEQFSLVMRSIDLSKAFQFFEEEGSGYELGEYISAYLFQDPEVKKHLPPNIQISKETGAYFENFEPFLLLRLLALNQENMDRSVQWRFSEVIDGGWIDHEELIYPLPSESRILIVTEGKSDTFVIKRTIEELYRDISDFFDFVDMKENYPFTGTGSLLNFCQGLSRIKIQNKVIVLFDNDAVGVEAYNKATQLVRPKSMVTCLLPSHTDFESVTTIGPSGINKENINGSAVAIECFLDWKQQEGSQYLVRWNSFNSSQGKYQGAIENKDELVRDFKKGNLSDGTYDTSKLRYLINHLLKEWIKAQ
jgi:5S rRNA maturation endonuclease (ribonuclease M5)